MGTYFWQASHSMIPLASWIDVWCTNTGYSVSQGCSRSCFLCLWAVGGRHVCEEGYHLTEALGSPSVRAASFSLLQVTSTQQKAPRSLEASLSCWVALARSPEIFLQSTRGYPAVLLCQSTLCLLRPSSEGSVGKAQWPGNTWKWRCRHDIAFARSHKA